MDNMEKWLETLWKIRGTMIGQWLENYGYERIQSWKICWTIVGHWWEKYGNYEKSIPPNPLGSQNLPRWRASVEPFKIFRHANISTNMKSRHESVKWSKLNILLFEDKGFQTCTLLSIILWSKMIHHWTAGKQNTLLTGPLNGCVCVCVTRIQDLSW